MRKIVPLLLAMLFCLAPLTAMAETVYLSELEMSITLPEGLMLFTRDTDEADENLALADTTAEELKAQFIKDNIYLSAIHVDPLYEYVVTMVTDSDMQDVQDFSDYTDDELAEIADYMLEAAPEAGLTYSGYEIAHIGSYTFFVLPLTHAVDGMQVYGNQYYTIYNGKAINVTLQSYEGEITPELKAEHRAIMESIILPAKSGSAKKSGIDWNEALQSALIGMISCSIGLAVISAMANRKKKKKQGAYQYEGAPIPEKRLMSLLPTAYCKKCGAKLLETDQEYCAACGARGCSGK